MTLSVVKLGEEIARATFPFQEWAKDSAGCMERLKESLKQSGVRYDRIEPWNPCKLFTGKKL